MKIKRNLGPNFISLTKWSLWQVNRTQEFKIAKVFWSIIKKEFEQISKKSTKIGNLRLLE